MAGDGLVHNGRAARLIHSTWGAVLALATAAVVGGVAGQWASSMSRSPEDVAELKVQAQWMADSINTISRRSIWIVCTAVPPNRADVLAALQISCRYVSDLPVINLHDVLKDEEP